MLNKKQLASAKKLMKLFKDDHIDYTTNQVNTTSLTEAVACHMDLYEDRTSYVIPEELFELAGNMFPEDR